MNLYYSCFTPEKRPEQKKKKKQLELPIQYIDGTLCQTITDACPAEHRRLRQLFFSHYEPNAVIRVISSRLGCSMVARVDTKYQPKSLQVDETFSVRSSR